MQVTGIPEVSVSALSASAVSVCNVGVCNFATPVVTQKTGRMTVIPLISRPFKEASIREARTPLSALLILLAFQSRVFGAHRQTAKVGLLVVLRSHVQCGGKVMI